MPQWVDDITPSVTPSRGTQWVDDPPTPQRDYSFGSGYGMPSWGDIGLTALKIPIQLGETLVGLGDLAVSPLQYGADKLGFDLPNVSKSLEYVGYDPKMTKEFISSFESEELKRARQEFAKAQGFSGSASELWRNPGLAGLAIEESLPYLAGGAGIARGAMAAAPRLAPWVAGALGEAVIGAGSQAAAIREEKGEFDYTDAPLAAASGAATGILSGAGGRVATKFGLPDVDAFLADQSIRGARRIPGLIGAGITEAGEEAAQSAQEQAALNYATGKPIGEGVGSSALMGGVTGGIMGGTVPAFRRSGAPPISPLPELQQPDLPFGPMTGQQNLFEESIHPIERYDQLADLGVRGPEQQTELDALRQQLGIDQRPTGGPQPGIDPWTGKFRKIPTGPPQQMGLDLQAPADETGQMELFDMGQTPPPTGGGPTGGINIDITGPQVIPEGSSLSENQHVATINDPTTAKYWQSKGYVFVEGLRSAPDAKGRQYPQMVRGDVAPLYVGKKTGPPTPRGAVGQPTGPEPALTQMPGAGPFRGTTAPATGPIVVPNEVADKPGYTENLTSKGWKAVRGATRTTFTRLMKEEEGSSDIEMRIINWAIRKFQERFGRQPNEQELAAEVDTVKSQMGPQAGEPTGAVAPFDPGFQVDTSHPANNMPPVDPAQLQQFLTGVQASVQPPMEDEGDVTPDEIPLNMQKWNTIPGGPWGLGIPEPATGRHVGIPPQAGQQGLPMVSGLPQPEAPIDALVQENRMRQIANAEAAELARTPLTEPTQQSMIPAFQDAEIADYLRREDATPPEMRDLSEYGPERMIPPSDEPHFEREFPREVENVAGFEPDANRSSTRTLQLKRADELEAQGRKAEADALREQVNNYLNEREPKDILNLINDKYRNDPATLQRAIEIYLEQDLAKIADNYNRQTEEIQELTLNTERLDAAFDAEYLRLAELKNLARSKYERASLRQIEPRFMPGEEPYFARAKGGGLTASVNITRAVENITRDYTSPLPAIMNREGMQNGLDASDKKGSQGQVRVRLNAPDNTIEIHDNGSGLDEEGLSTKLVEIFATGKEGEEGATGGKGIGSASYIYGGEHFTVESIAVDKKDGKKYRIIASGTPTQFLDPVKGSDWDRQPIAPSTPTGTTITVKLKDEQDLSDAKDMLDKVTEFSRNRPSTVFTDPYGSTSGIPLKDVKQSDLKAHKFKDSSKEKMIGDFTTTNRNSDVKIFIPKGRPEKRSEIQIHYLNNGMYQFSERMHVGEADDVPENVLVDIHPLVDDLNDLYPFINTREDIKRDIRQEVTQFIEKNIKNPAISKRKNRTQELYDSMSFVPATGTNRKTVIYDPGNRLTKQEVRNITANPTIQALVKVYDRAIADILNASGRQKWVDRVEGVGLVFDNGLHGIHIPNPTTGKSTILINPFLRISDPAQTPKIAAWNNTITNLHEVAHVGTEHGTEFQLTPQDLQDPRVGEFLSSYMNQLVRHGDIGMWTNTGHGMDFAHRLMEVFSKYGIQRTFATAAEIHRITTGGNPSGGYSSDIQRLLQLYQESRGRDATTEDLLSPTGVKQGDRERGREGGIPSDTTTDGDGAAAKVAEAFRRFIGEEEGSLNLNPRTWGWGQGQNTGTTPFDPVQWAKEKTGWGMGRMPPPPDKEYNVLREMLAVPTSATTTGDVSYIGRQGLSTVFTRQFPRAVWDSLRAAHYGTYKKITDDLEQNKIHQQGIDLATGDELPSYAQTAGLKLLKPASESGPRAEGASSRWLEVGVGNDPFSKIWKHTVGYPVRMTNRMFITFFNSWKTNRMEYLSDKAEKMSLRAAQGKRVWEGISPLGKKFNQTDAENLNPYQNILRAKEIADFLNTATGQAPLKTHLLPYKGAEVSLEAASKALSMGLFSPGLMASRVRMLNPSTYIMATPFVRKQYMHAALSAAAAWFVFTNILKAAAGDEAEVGDDPLSADFGKVRIGNTRLDAGGGFLQFLVAYGRAWTGEYASSATGEHHRFGSGFQAPTQAEYGERFLANKLNPVAKLVYDWASATEYKPLHVYDRLLQLFIPLAIQDIWEILEEDPSLLPVVGPAAQLGAGTQTYSKGESVAKFVDPENDWIITGGGIRDLMPWNWEAEQ